MAEQYQLPSFQLPSTGGLMGEVALPQGFRPPDMTGIIDRAADREINQLQQFNRSMELYTNIMNADREMSLRERDFQRKVLSDDRNFQLLREKQDSDLRMDEIRFEAARYNYEKAKQNDQQLADAYSKLPEYQQAFSEVFPAGGAVADFNSKINALRSRFVKNPSDAIMFNDVSKPYYADQKTYIDSGVEKNHGVIQFWLSEGYFNNIQRDDAGNITGSQPLTFGGLTADETYKQALAAYARGDMTEYYAKMAPLMEIGKDKQRAREQSIRMGALQQAGEIAGLPVTEISLGKEGELTGKVAMPRVSALGRQTTGAGTDKALAAYDKAAQSAFERMQALEEDIVNITDPADKMIADAQMQSLRKDYELYSGLARSLVQQQQQPAQAGAPQPSGAPSVLGPLPKAPEIKRKEPTPEKTKTEPKPVSQVPTGEELLLSPTARAVLETGRTAKRGGIGLAQEAFSKIPAIGPATKQAVEVGIPLVETVLPAAQRVGQEIRGVTRELSSYSKLITQAEKNARERAAKGEDYNQALADERRKLIEQASAAQRTPAITQTF